MNADLELLLREDPGNPAFVDFAKQLRANGDLDRAQEVCLKGLSANPGLHLGRLVLAQIFYEKGLYPFAAQQIQTLTRECRGVKSLTRLLSALSPDLKAGESSSEHEQIAETVAEAEIDIGLIDEIEENVRSSK